MEEVEKYNHIYQERGFQGVIREVENRLHCGKVIKKDDGLYCIVTGGWSDDEELLCVLNSFMSMFAYKHYVGKLRGGAFYYAEENIDDYTIQKKVDLDGQKE